jgi:hypothetical protein
MKSAPGKLLFFITGALMFAAGCGGGGGGSSSVTSSFAAAFANPLTIATAASLPGTLEGHAYTATLTATGGQGPLKWSISPILGMQFVTGLTLDESTGVISGTPAFTGVATFVGTVKDSGTPAQTATRTFSMSVSPPLSLAFTQEVTIPQFSSLVIISLSPFMTGGVPPFTYTMDGSCLPPGMRSGSTNVPVNSPPQIAVGSPYAVGTYSCPVTVQDSFTPPEVASALLTIKILPQYLSVADGSFPSLLLLNRPFSTRLVVTGEVCRPTRTLSSRVHCRPASTQLIRIPGT